MDGSKRDDNYMGWKEKVYDLQTISSQVAKWKNQGFDIVMTNGCFDIIHLGHVHYLAEARRFGDKLIVALNSDTSVSKLKGEHRPLQNIDSRIGVMASLGMVDAVVVFEEDTPIKVIESVVPSVLVKGGDYTVDQVIGAKEVQDAGGKVEILSFIDGYSTSAIEAKIKLQKENSYKSYVQIEIDREDDLSWAVKLCRIYFGDTRHVVLIGNLGAGKTTWVKYFCAELGVDPSEVHSPTYSLVNEYPILVKNKIQDTVYHLDLFRIEDEAELYGIGLEDYLSRKSYVLIEWADLALAWLDTNAKWIKLSHVGNTEKRIISMGKLK